MKKSTIVIIVIVVLMIIGVGVYFILTLGEGQSKSPAQLVQDIIKLTIDHIRCGHMIVSGTSEIGTSGYVWNEENQQEWGWECTPISYLQEAYNNMGDLLKSEGTWEVKVTSDEDMYSVLFTKKDNSFEFEINHDLVTELVRGDVRNTSITAILNGLKKRFNDTVINPHRACFNDDCDFLNDDRIYNFKTEISFNKPIGKVTSAFMEISKRKIKDKWYLSKILIED